jgi:LssY C-terminus
MTRRRAGLWIGLAVLLWAGVAYGLAPLLWRHYEHQQKLDGRPMITRTADGAPGDPINVGLEGAAEDVDCALRAAGWRAADPVKLRTSVHIIASVLARREYLTAPVSALFYDGRKQDLAYEKAAAASPSRRHHVRFWRALDQGDDGAPVWLGAATYDRSVGFSHRTGQITHHIAADVDAERDELTDDLAHGGHVEATYRVSGIGPTLMGRNGGGDRYFTDGEVVVSRLRQGCVAESAAPEALPAPVTTQWKDWVFVWLKREGWESW